jgi:hypothetical protein
MRSTPIENVFLNRLTDRILLREGLVLLRTYSQKACGTIGTCIFVLACNFYSAGTVLLARRNYFHRVSGILLNSHTNFLGDALFMRIVCAKMSERCYEEVVTIETLKKEKIYLYNEKVNKQI